MSEGLSSPWPIGLLALEGLALCLILFWLLRQQSFLQELFHTLSNLERRNREAQRDLFLILQSSLGFQRYPLQNPEAGLPYPQLGGSRELTPGELVLLALLSTKGASSLTEIRKAASTDLESTLQALRDKGFIFFSDFSDQLVLAPEAYAYLKAHSPFFLPQPAPTESLKTHSLPIPPQRRFPARWTLASLLALAALLIAFPFLRYLPELWQEKAPTPPPLAPDAKARPPPVALPQVFPQPPSTKPPHRLIIKAKEQAWIHALIDGKQEREVLLQPDEKVEWLAQEGFLLTLGNAGGVRLTLNGQPLPPLGVSGQVIRNLRLPPPPEQGTQNS